EAHPCSAHRHPHRGGAGQRLPAGFLKVPSLMPRSLAACAMGRPVSRTSRTAPSLKSWLNVLRVSAIAVLLSKRCVHVTRETHALDGGGWAGGLLCVVWG